VVGFFVGAALLLIFFFCALLSTAGAGVLLGAGIERFLFRRPPFPLSYRPVLLGILLFSFLFVIPYVGFVINFIAFLAVLGALMTQLYRHFVSSS
jgi:hypothetical protein